MPEEQIVTVAHERLSDVFAVVSQVSSADGAPHYRRKVHLSLSAAQNAVKRARERGLQAMIVLCRMEPVEAEEDAWTHGSRLTT
ncbi:hypothetical protein GCM10027060_18900 [Nesterenkonia halophila]|uniref:hypothetical protein n=1 Tax=Nesterenkonia halophila TaxID=302044 RepID=UPI0012928432|nr:hypothetical protein [Nesterenkonia halophila]